MQKTEIILKWLLSEIAFQNEVATTEKEFAVEVMRRCCSAERMLVGDYEICEWLNEIAANYTTYQIYQK